MTATKIVLFVFGSLFLASLIGALPEFIYSFRRWRADVRDANECEEE